MQASKDLSEYKVRTKLLGGEGGEANLLIVLKFYHITN